MLRIVKAIVKIVEAIAEVECQSLQRRYPTVGGKQLRPVDCIG